jgi:PAS domain S-box-containing protein
MEDICLRRPLQSNLESGIQFAKRVSPEGSAADSVSSMAQSTPATQIPDIQLFRDVFNASPIGIAVENLDGQPLFANPALSSMLGFSEEELRGKHCVQFSPPDDAEKDWALFQKLRAGSIDHYQLEKRYLRRDGSLFWGRMSLSLLNHRLGWCWRWSRT